MIDNAERLRDMESTLLQAVMRLPQLVSERHSFIHSVYFVFCRYLIIFV